MQTRELREYAERRGWSVFAEYVDIGISGTKETRPELDRLMADTHRRRFDAVVVWKFDRFARSVSHLLRALETFRALGIRVRFVLRAARHQHTCRQDGLYRPGRRGGARAWLDRRAGEGRASERQGERQAAWAPQDQRQSRSD
jgi:Resolvase, N terminal domain